MLKFNRGVSIVLSSVLLLACAVWSLSAKTSSAGDFPVGNYSEGDFFATFTADGKFVIKAEDGLIKVEAQYKVEGDQIVFSEKDGKGECAEPGKYKWNFDGKVLTFIKLEDSCSGRHSHLTARLWTRVK
jgi:hypothetical protein